ELLVAPGLSASTQPLAFTRSRDGWIFVAARCAGSGTTRIILDAATRGDTVVVQAGPGHPEAVHYLAKGGHTIRVEITGDVVVDRLTVKAIPELIHCGLGFNPEIKSYGLYDLDFLKSEILPNVTTLIVPSSLKLPESVVDDWHRQGKRFVGEVGINT